MSEYKWRESLNKGDKVLKRYRETYSIDVVTGRTPTGSLKFESGDLLKPNEAWSRDNFCYEHYDEVAEGKLRLQEKKQKFINLKESVSINDLTEEELDAIISILDKKIFQVRSILGEYVIDIVGDSIRTNRNVERATYYTYEEALKMKEEASRILEQVFNVYKGGYRVR